MWNSCLSSNVDCINPPMSLRPAVIIPVYNHGLQIAEVISQARRLDLPIFVVNDGSTDVTEEVLASISGITILRHSVNQGKGAAILTGMAAALEDNCNWAITLDGDGQHNPVDARNLLQVAETSGRCIVVGCRQGMDESRNVPWTSRFGRGFSNFWVWASGGPWVADSQSGFRLYPLPEILQLEITARRYQFEVEVLVAARQKGITTREAPVSVVYQPRGERVSHFRPWLDFHRNSATFCRLIFARIFRLFRL